MWLGLFQPLPHDAVGGKLAAAGDMSLDDTKRTSQRLHGAAAA